VKKNFTFGIELESFPKPQISRISSYGLVTIVWDK